MFADRSEPASAGGDLVHLALDLAGSLEARTVITRILEHGLAIAAADRATLSSLAGDRLTIEASVGRGGHVTWVGREYPREILLRQPLVADMFAGRSAVLGGAMVVDEADPEFKEALDPVRRTAVLPILEGGEITGMLVLSRYVDTPFQERDIPVLTGFGALAGVALRNAKLYEEATATSRRLEAAATAAAEVATLDSLPALVQRIVEHSCEAAGADSAAIMRVEDGFGIIEATLGTAPLGSRWPLGDEILEAIGAGEAVQVVAGAAIDAELQKHASPYGPTLVAPLRFSGALLGLLVLARHKGRSSFSAGDIAGLQQFAGLAALLLHNGRMVHRLREAEATKREFMNVVVHELRGPLSVIEGYTEMLLDDRSETWTDEVKDQLAAIRRQSGHARSLAEDLLMLARLESDDLGIARQNVAIGEVVDDAVDRARAAAKLRMGTVRVDRLEPVSAIGDRTLVARILDNLLRNAVVYSRAEPDVAITATADGNGVHIRVLDHGPGVPVDEQELIFGRFSRGSRAGSVMGNGLGLYVSRECARRMDGDLVLESSSADTGSCFLLTLPLTARA